MSLLARSGPDESSAEATTSGSAQDPKARRSSVSLTTTATDDEDGHGEDEEEEEDENERTSTSKSGGGGSEKGGEPKKKGKSTKAKWKKIKNAVGVSKEVTSATMRRAQLRIRRPLPRPLLFRSCRELKPTRAHICLHWIPSRRQHGKPH